MFFPKFFSFSFWNLGGFIIKGGRLHEMYVHMHVSLAGCIYGALGKVLHAGHAAERRGQALPDVIWCNNENNATTAAAAAATATANDTTNTTNHNTNVAWRDIMEHGIAD